MGTTASLPTRWRSPASSLLGSNFPNVHWIIQCLTVPGTLAVLQSAQVWRGDGRKEVLRPSQQRIIGSIKCDTGRKLEALRLGTQQVWFWQKNRKAKAEAPDSLLGALFCLFYLRDAHVESTSAVWEAMKADESILSEEALEPVCFDTVVVCHQPS